MESSFLDEMLELYEIIIRNKIYSFHSGMYLQSKIFMNIVFMAIMNDKKEWLEEFIKEHNRKIDPEFREHLLNFAKARILFSECKYEDVLVKISRIKDIKDSDILLSLRDFQLMIYFELDMVESIFLEIDSYSHFLKKETSLPEARRTLYKNFLKIYNKVFLMKLNDEVHNASDIRNELILLENIDEREWLNEKINQIEKSAQKAN